MNILQILWSSLADSTYMVLFAVAFSLVLKVTKVWNFAQGGLVVAVFYSMHLLRVSGEERAILLLSVGILTALLFHAAVEVAGFRGLRRTGASPMIFFIFALVVTQLVAYLATLQFGNGSHTLTTALIWPSTTVFGILVTQWEVIALALAATGLAASWIFFRLTKPGRSAMAVSNNARLAELYGLSAQAAYLWTMLAAAVLVGIGTYIMGLRVGVSPETGGAMILLPVAATIIGGIGNVWGAAVAAVGLSLVKGFSLMIFPSVWENFILYTVMFLLLLLLPQGFIAFVRKSRVQLPAK